MAATKLVSRTYTFVSSVPVALNVIMGFLPHAWIKSVTLRPARTNSGDVFWQGVGAESGGYLGPGEAAVIDFGEDEGPMSDICLSSTASNTVYLSVSVNVNSYAFERH